MSIVRPAEIWGIGTTRGSPHSSCFSKRDGRSAIEQLPASRSRLLPLKHIGRAADGPGRFVEGNPAVHGDYLEAEVGPYFSIFRIRVGEATVMGKLRKPDDIRVVLNDGVVVAERSVQVRRRIVDDMEPDRAEVVREPAQAIAFQGLEAAR